jgi:hypothetical protein
MSPRKRKSPKRRAKPRGPDYRVYRGKTFLGTVTQTGTDMPFFEGTFEPAPGFRSVRRMFDRERQLLDADRMDEWQEAYDKLAVGLRMEPTNGREPITELLLHIDGRLAWWRY